MDIFLNILFSFITVAILGALLGLGLAYASGKLKVEKDNRIQDVENLLPGYNCGACGYAGCASYAEAVTQDEDVPVNKCLPGGSDTARFIAEYLGREIAGEGIRMVAMVHCGGTVDKAKKAFDYQGLGDCNAMYMHFNGDKECKYGCLGEGSCIKVCPVGAISKTGTGIVKVDPEKCISCGKCIEICPTGVIKMVPYGADYIIACNSPEKGGIVRKVCTAGCIGCKICEKKFPESGIKVENNLAEIDYNLGGDQVSASGACPSKCIVKVDYPKNQE